MDESKKVSTPLVAHIRLITEQCPSTKEKKIYMESIPYVSTMENLMCMVYTRPVIAHVITLVSKYLSNLGRMHWSTVK